MLKKLLICGLVSSAAIASENISEKLYIDPNRQITEKGYISPFFYPLSKDLNQHNYHNYLLDGLTKSTSPEIRNAAIKDLRFQYTLTSGLLYTSLATAVIIANRALFKTVFISPAPSISFLFSSVERNILQSIPFYVFGSLLVTVLTKQEKLIDTFMLSEQRWSILPNGEKKPMDGPYKWEPNQNLKADSKNASNVFKSIYTLPKDLNDQNYHNYLSECLKKSLAPEVLETYKKDITGQRDVSYFFLTTCLGIGTFNLGRLFYTLPATSSNFFPFLRQLTTKTVPFFGLALAFFNVSSRQWKQLSSIENAIHNQKIEQVKLKQKIEE